MVVIHRMTTKGSVSDLRHRRTDAEKCKQARIMRDTWRGALNEKHLMSVKSCWQQNIQHRARREIWIWVDDVGKAAAENLSEPLRILVEPALPDEGGHPFAAILRKTAATGQALALTAREAFTSQSPHPDRKNNFAIPPRI